MFYTFESLPQKTQDDYILNTTYNAYDLQCNFSIYLLRICRTTIFLVGNCLLLSFSAWQIKKGNLVLSGAIDDIPDVSANADETFSAKSTNRSAKTLDTLS